MKKRFAPFNTKGLLWNPMFKIILFDPTWLRPLRRTKKRQCANSTNQLTKCNNHAKT